MEEIVLKAITHKELSPKEKSQLDDWLKESLKNRMIFNQLKLTMRYPDAERVQEMKSAGLEKFKKEIAENRGRTVEIRKNKWPIRFIKVAATLVLILSISIVIYKIQHAYHQTIEHAELRLIEKTSLPGQKITVTLTDGTVVKLNSDSKIIVPEHFDSNHRIVELVGEAFFDVNRDTERPFIIKTKDLRVEVLGTSFNVKSYDTDIRPMVAVKTGKVAVNKIEGNDAVYLEPNEIVRLTNDGNLSKKAIDNNELVFGWTEQRLVFEETVMEEVFEQLSRWYGVEIIIEEEIENKRPYTASYKNPTVEEVFKSLSHLYQFDYENNGKQIVINKQ